VSRLRNRLLNHPSETALQPCAEDKSAATSASAAGFTRSLAYSFGEP
jgi:hypothetical protein